MPFNPSHVTSNLDENALYFVYGKNYKRLTEAETFILVKQVFYSPETWIKKENPGPDIDINIGDIRCDVDSVRIWNRFEK